MKKILTTLCLAILFIVSHAQWNTSGNDIYNSNSGNVGIGTGTVAPTARLQVVSTGSVSTNWAFKVHSTSVVNPDLFNVRADGYIHVGNYLGSLTIGYECGYNPAYQENHFVGFRVGQDATTADNCVGFGSSALSNLTSGTKNVAMGNSAMGGNAVTGSYNSAFGHLTARNNTSGNFNSAFGSQAGFYNLTGSTNTFLGAEAGYKKTSGNSNVIIGYAALYNNVSGSNNVSVGTESAFSNKTGSNNLYLGHQAGFYGTFSNKGFIDNQNRGDSATQMSSVPVIIDFNATVSSQNINVNGNLKVMTGKVGIATTSPSEKLTVAGRVRSTTSDIVVESNSRGLILKDTQATPHYWRLTISNLGVLTTTDVGTSLPSE